MKWQGWRGSVVGVFASLSLIGLAGAGVASEPYFEVVAKAGEAPAVVVPQSEPSFEVAPQSGETFAATTTQAEPYFEVAPEASKAVATSAPQSEHPLGLRTVEK
jgi:hypothetical protein